MAPSLAAKSTEAAESFKMNIGWLLDAQYSSSSGHATVPVSPDEQGLSPLTISPTEKKCTFESIHRAAGQPNPPKMPPALALRVFTVKIRFSERLYIRLTDSL